MIYSVLNTFIIGLLNFAISTWLYYTSADQLLKYTSVISLLLIAEIIVDFGRRFYIPKYFLSTSENFKYFSHVAVNVIFSAVTVFALGIFQVMDWDQLAIWFCALLFFNLSDPVISVLRSCGRYDIEFMGNFIFRIAMFILFVQNFDALVVISFTFVGRHLFYLYHTKRISRRLSLTTKLDFSYLSVSACFKIWMSMLLSVLSVRIPILYVLHSTEAEAVNEFIFASTLFGGVSLIVSGVLNKIYIDSLQSRKFNPSILAGIFTLYVIFFTVIDVSKDRLVELGIFKSEFSIFLNEFFFIFTLVSLFQSVNQALRIKILANGSIGRDILRVSVVMLFTFVFAAMYAVPGSLYMMFKVWLLFEILIVVSRIKV